MPETTKCGRRACDTTLTHGHYRIWNEPSTGEPRLYCIRCGRRIIEGNEHDDLKLEYEIIDKHGNLHKDGKNPCNSSTQSSPSSVASSTTSAAEPNDPEA